MTRARLFVLIFGPLPIVAASVALSLCLKSDKTLPVAANDVLGLPALTSVADGAERVSKSPRAAAARHTAKDPLSELCRQSAAQLKKRLAEGGQVIVRPPFVIAGDMTVEELDSWHQRTIRPAADAMANSYFSVTPTQPITVLLFPGETSYNENAKKLFEDNGISVYGYYKPQSRTLVMNIGTGGGTLVHELTHALIDFDFPDVPDWFNEGLASLHEQCRFRDGEDGAWVEGLENWRLAGLQKTIRAKRLRPLKTMIEANDFRGELEGVNYAQARYLCLYLQRQGALAKFYKQFRDGHAKDPFGVKSLENVLQITSWSQLDRDFQKWALALEQ